jgi:two-component system LytT family response regulator
VSLPLRVLIADDEPLVRRAIRDVIEGESAVEIAGEASDGPSAIAAIEELAPDLVFLDVQMPELDGFGVLEALEPGSRPSVVFVTAHSQYAVRAFEEHAVHYLLKPVDAGRIVEALERARSGLESGADGDRIERLLDAGSRPNVLRRFTVRERGRIHFVDVEGVERIGVEGNYIRLYRAQREHLVRMPLTRVIERAPAGVFVRVHRSAAVGIRFVHDVRPLGTGDYHIRMLSGAEVRLSRTMRDGFFRTMEEVGRGRLSR